jgi:hypothetical protein
MNFFNIMTKTAIHVEEMNINSVFPFYELLKCSVRFIMSVRMQQFDSHWKDFRKIL